MKTVNIILPNETHADDRWRPTLTSHVHWGKHHRCVQQQGQTVLFCKTSEALSHHKNSLIAFKYYYFSCLTKVLNVQQWKCYKCATLTLIVYSTGMLVLFTNVPKYQSPWCHGFPCCGHTTSCECAGLCLSFLAPEEEKLLRLDRYFLLWWIVRAMGALILLCCCLCLSSDVLDVQMWGEMCFSSDH